MHYSKWTWIVAGSLTAASGLAFQVPVIIEQVPKEIFNMWGISVDAPATATDDAVHDAIQSYMIQGESLPLGYQLRGDEGGRVRAIWHANVTGGQQALVTVYIIDNPLDLDVAEVYINGQLQGVASRANGTIEDRGSESIATIEIVAPMNPPVLSVVVWNGLDGTHSKVTDFWSF